MMLLEPERLEDAGISAMHEDALVWCLWIDGTAAPNPGPLGLGIVLESPAGERQEVSVRAASGCSNMAELQALLGGLKLARKFGARGLRIFSDSDFVVRHASGEQTTASVALQAVVTEVIAELANFRWATLHWIPRHRNGMADALARHALGLEPKPAHRPVSKKRRR